LVFTFEESCIKGLFDIFDLVVDSINIALINK